VPLAKQNTVPAGLEFTMFCIWSALIPGATSTPVHGVGLVGVVRVVVVGVVEVEVVVVGGLLVVVLVGDVVVVVVVVVG
jgi:hypothetical protein